MKISKSTKTVKKPVSKSIEPKPVGGSLLVYDITGVKTSSKLNLPKEVLKVKENPKLLAQYIRVYLANQRQGTASTKTRAEVRGSTRKIYRQKGTGRARHGSRRASLFIGGGITFGPKPRDYSMKMNKKQKKQALFQSLKMKSQEQNIVGLANSALKIDPKTKVITNFLKKLDFDKNKVLFVLPEVQLNNFVRAARNISNVQLTGVKTVNPYILLKNEKIVMVADALKVFEDHFGEKDAN
jgi:large subunit ribosomal protein L4